MKPKIYLIPLLSLILLSTSLWAGLNEDLYKAAKKGDKKKVTALIKKGANINAKGKYGTSLHIAIAMLNTEIAKLLIANGADINAKSDFGMTPLHLAAKGNYIKIAKLLIAKGADVNAKSDTFGTPLHLAVTQEVAELFIVKGAKINVKNKMNGFTPLHRAVYGGRTEVVKVLLDKGADIHAKDSSGGTPLHAISMFSKTETIKLLLAKGANVNAKNSDGQTPLDLTKKDNMKKLLKKHGAKSGK